MYTNQECNSFYKSGKRKKPPFVTLLFCSDFSGIIYMLAYFESESPVLLKFHLNFQWQLRKKISFIKFNMWHQNVRKIYYKYCMQLKFILLTSGKYYRKLLWID